MRLRAALKQRAWSNLDIACCFHTDCSYVCCAEIAFTMLFVPARLFQYLSMGCNEYGTVGKALVDLIRYCARVPCVVVCIILYVRLASGH